jgi:hypothetical protein
MHSLSSGQPSLREAVGRGIASDLGEAGLTNVVAESRAPRKIVRSALLPNVSGYLSETVRQINLGAAGFSFDQRISQPIPGLSIPTVVGSAVLALATSLFSLVREETHKQIDNPDLLSRIASEQPVRQE